MATKEMVTADSWLLCFPLCFSIHQASLTCKAIAGCKGLGPFPKEPV